MSYARMGEDSDVYVIAQGVYDEDGNKTGKMKLCCFDSGNIFCTPSGKEMIEHLKKHQEEGRKVPDYVFERIEGEMQKYGTWVYPLRKR